MSILGTILQFALSPFGLLAVLLGFVTFLLMPALPRVTGEFHRLSNFAVWLSLWILSRAAIVVSEHGGLLLKSMTFDSLGVEKMTFADETKEFDDPDAALHQWMGFPFTLADEVHGVLFDPRHAALGNRKQAAKDRGEWRVDASVAEWNQFELSEWMRGAFAMPTDHELVDLSGVRALTHGSERGEYPQRIEELYKKSREALNEGRSTSVKFLIIVIAMVAPFAGLWLIASQGGASATGSTVSGLSGSFIGLLFMARRAGDGDGDSGSGPGGANWRAAVLAIVLLGTPTAILGVIAVYLSPVLSVIILLFVAMGFLAIPFLAALVRFAGLGNEAMARGFMKLGLMGFDRPVFVWEPRGYRLREYRKLETAPDVSWYGFCGATVGFSFLPSPDAWGAEVLEQDDIDSYRDDTGIATDGGETPDSQIPATHGPAPDLRNGGIGGFLPNRTSDTRYYLDTSIAMSRFEDAAMGRKVLNRLLWAKENHDGEVISDTAVMYAVVACALVSFIAGIVVFFL